MNNIITSKRNILNKKAVLKITNEIIKIMAISDTHLGCRQDRVDYLKYFYEYAEKYGVDFIIHCGDLTDGYLDYPDQIENLKYKTFAEQKEYVIDVYPKSSIPTIIVSGNHDLSWLYKMGMDILEEIVKVRNDLYYMGASSGIIIAGNLKIGLIHGYKKYNKEIRELLVRPDFIFKGHTHYFARVQTKKYNIIKVPCLVNFRAHPDMQNKQFILGAYIAEINIENREIISNELIKCSKDGTKRVLRL